MNEGRERLRSTTSFRSTRSDRSRGTLKEMSLASYSNLADVELADDEEDDDKKLAGRTFLSTRESLFNSSILPGDLKGIQYAVAHGVDVNAPNCFGRTPLHNACEVGEEDTIDFLIKSAGASILMVDKWGENVFHRAVKRRQSNALDVIADLAGDSCEFLANQKNRDGKTPLHLASLVGNSAAAITLTTKGADPNAQDDDGHSPLHLAAQKGDANVMKVLVDRSNVKINLPDKAGHTALHIAIWHNNPRIVTILLDKDANKDAQAKNGDTPLHIAMKAQNLNIVISLIRRRVSLRVENNAGATVKDIAKEMGYLELAQYIIDEESRRVTQETKERVRQEAREKMLMEKKLKQSKPSAATIASRDSGGVLQKKGPSDSSVAIQVRAQKDLFLRELANRPQAEIDEVVQKFDAFLATLKPLPVKKIVDVHNLSTKDIRRMKRNNGLVGGRDTREDMARFEIFKKEINQFVNEGSRMKEGTYIDESNTDRSRQVTNEEVSDYRPKTAHPTSGPPMLENAFQAEDSKSVRFDDSMLGNGDGPTPVKERPQTAA